VGEHASGLRRGILALAAVLLVGGLPGSGGDEPSGDHVDWGKDLSSIDKPDVHALPLKKAVSARVARDQPGERASVHLPAPGVTEVSLGGVGVDKSVGSTPIELAAGSSQDAGLDLQVEVLDQGVTEAAGVSAFAMRVTGQGGASLSDDADAADATTLPVNVKVDTSDWAGLYGAGYAGRLKVVALPRCALRQPVSDGCDLNGVPVPSHFNAKTGELVMTIKDLASLDAATLPSDEVPLGPPVQADDLTAATDPAVSHRSSGLTTSRSASVQAEGASGIVRSGGSGAVLALTSATSGEEGNWNATPLQVSGGWQVGVGSGEFSWSYDVPVPPAPGGATPSVRLSYSSSSVDGMVTGRNVQAGQNGLGWTDFANAFIERRYAPCDEGEVFHDLCWRSNNATISLDGRQTELVPVDGGQYVTWVLKDDPHWRVEHRNLLVPNGDNDGENWVVTTPDGTEYFFGLGVDPSGGLTESTWTVPVFANDSGEPCRASGDALGWCHQAWRWNLDRVVDPDGNVTVYRYQAEENKYGILNGWGDVGYNNGGRLNWIEYGLREDDTSVPAAGKVEFTASYRCNTLDVEGTPECPVPTKDNGDLFKDVPNEFICSSNCLVPSPTFFSRKRYQDVRTSIRVPGQGYPEVDVVRLTHTLGDNGEGDKSMWLRAIQRFGKVGLGSGSFALPPVRFNGDVYHNRVDYDPTHGATAMEQYRLTVISEEYGKQIRVTYGRPNGCTPGTNPRPSGDWDMNDQSCFPQYWRPPGATADEIAVFHKWLVTEVEEKDLVSGSQSMITTYAYGGTPAWHHNDDEFLNNNQKTWSDWRGYATARVTNGTSATRYRIYRGMDGDRLRPIPGTNRRHVDITSLDGTVTKPDNNHMAGRILDQAQIDVNDNTLVSTLTEYQSDKTSDWGAEDQDDAFWVGNWKTTESRKRLDGTLAKRRTTYTYNLSTNPVGTGYVANYMPRSMLEEGWLDITGDERCTRTTYANNTTLRMYVYPATQTLVAGNDCNSTASADLLKAHEWLYDDGALGAAPTRGHVTKTRAQKTKSPVAWQNYTQTSYDALGRVTSVTDPDDHTTTTAYTPAVGNPTTTTVTNAKGQASTTDWMIERGLPRFQTDANAKHTELDYDALGRLTSVWRPTEEQMVPRGPASLKFSYDIDSDKTKPPVVRSQRLVSIGSTPTYQDSWVVYDGFLRERQTHTLSPGPDKVIVQNTSYDDRGNVFANVMPEAVPGTPGSGILRPADQKEWANQTRPSYDELNRVTTETFYGVNNDSTTRVEHWHSTNLYDFNKTWSVPPVGGQTVTTTDAYDQVTSVSEESNRTPGSHSNSHTTNYAYDLAGDLLTVTDPANNVITYTYDLLGRRTTQTDPDAGNWSYTYDDVDNQLSVTDALNTTRTTVYDELNRPTAHKQGTTTLATWDYDANGEKGLLDKSTRITPAGNWVTDITGYDLRNRPLGKKVTVPAGVSGLTGDYTTSYGYNQADQPTSITYPAAGGLPLETVTTSYWETLGLPASTSGTDAYVNGEGYDNRGRPALAAYGKHTGFTDPTMGRAWTYNNDQRLATVQTAATGGALVAEHDLAYDPLGNITERTTTLGANHLRECFKYDAYQRLTRVYTTGVTDPASCATDPGTPAGDLAYEQDFTHSDDGNLTSRDDGAGPTSLTYPASGANSVRPHAPTQMGSNTYQWNANGDLTSRTVGGINTNLTWDVEGNLASTTSTTGSSSFVYDADGQRLSRTTPQGTTLYLDGQEVTASPGASPTVTATRTYSFGGQPIAIRSTNGGVDYLVTDHQGTIEAKIDAGASVISASKAYKPYGQARTTDTFATQRGWIGQIEDPTTSLDYLNARYYDPSLGRFITPDPIYDTAHPKSLNSYTYAWSNPVTGSDPSGMFMDLGGGMQCNANYTGKKCINQGSNGPPGSGVDAPKTKSKPPPPSRPTIRSVEKVPKGEENAILKELAASGMSVELVKAIAAAGGPEEFMKQAHQLHLLHDIKAAANDLLHIKPKSTGICGDLDVIFGAGGSASGCWVKTQQDTGTVETLAGGAGVSISANAYAVISNADELDDFRGGGACAAVTVGGASGVACGGLDNNEHYNGNVEIYLGASFSPDLDLPMPAGGSLVYANSWAQVWWDESWNDMGTPCCVILW
jgi:RHS repeat-associated protein